MPREKIKRGRRGEAQKRKRDADGDVDAGGEELENGNSFKRRKPLPATEDGDEVEGDAALEGDVREYTDDMQVDESDYTHGERPFYGLLDESEQEYFKQAYGMLEVNQFDSAEERNIFVESVFKEASGKELKLACSQSCSKLLERLIGLATADQLKQLFQKLNGNFLHLVQHRFASHCCETLFIQSTPVVTQELIDPPPVVTAEAQREETHASMETLFLYAINELSGNFGYLMTDRFASHTLRVLLIVLAGRPLDPQTYKSLFASQKKDNIDIIQHEDSNASILEARIVPDSFTNTLEKLMSESVAGLETHYLRTLATHPTGNPALQLLVQLELTQFGKQKAKDANSIIRRLLPDDPIAEGTESASFVNALLYDAVGSRLLETIVAYAPGKIFKILFKELFKARMGTLARNETAGYVVVKILERLSAEDLKASYDQILPHIPTLAQAGRTIVIRALIERCHARNLDVKEIRDAIYSCWIDDDGHSFSVSSMFQLSPIVIQNKTDGQNFTPMRHHASEPALPTPSLAETNSEKQDLARLPAKTTPKPPKLQSSRSAPEPFNSAVVMHRSLLAQTMLKFPGPLSDLLFTAISGLPSTICLHLASTSVLSPILQCSLTAPHAPLIFRRKLITRFYSHFGNLSLDPAGSHLVDAIWTGTLGMAFVRERVAEELAENEAMLRENSYGRKVWRNWKMDLYKRRRGEWVRMVRNTAGNNGFLSFPDGVGNPAVTATGHSHPSRRSGLRSGNRPITGSANSDETRHSKNSNTNNAHHRHNQNTGIDRGKTRLDLARERHAMQKNTNAKNGRKDESRGGNGSSSRGGGGNISTA